MSQFPPARGGSFSPLSPTSMSFLKATLSSPLCLPPAMMTPYQLDSPSAFSTDVYTRNWGLATLSATPTLQDDQGLDAGMWLQDMVQSTLLQQSAVAPVLFSHKPVQSTVPPLSLYISDGESPDNSPVSSDVEDASPKPCHGHGTRRRSKRSFQDLQRSGSSSSLFTAKRSILDAEDDCDDLVVPLGEADANDEFVRAALLEDTQEAKAEAFPGLLEKARFLLNVDVTEDREMAAVSAILSAFTNDDKTGRPLPRTCQELLKQATEEVTHARKRQRESKTQRRSLLQNQVDEAFICNASGCNKRYTTAEGLRLHIRNHHEVDKKWICHAPDCSSERAFVRQADLRMHLIRMHSPVRPFPCRVPGCTKTFACHSELRRHIAGEHDRIVSVLLQQTYSS